MDYDTSMYKGNTDSTVSSKLCVRCLCMYALFYIFVCGFDTKKGLYIKKSFEMCIGSEFDRPEMTVRLSGRSIPTTTSWPASFKFHSQDLRN